MHEETVGSSAFFADQSPVDPLKSAIMGVAHFLLQL